MAKISDLTALTGAGVDDAADLLTIVDMSEAGAARNKKITIDETRIALGLSSADSPQFTAVNLGHASDTTITRVSAGVVAIEGVNIVTAAGGITFAADIIVPDEAYDATAWNGSLEVPTKNAVRDKIESISAGSGITVEDEGSSEGTGLTTLNFTGAGVSVTVVGAEAEVIIPGGATFASAAEVRAGTEAAKALSPDNVFDAAAYVALNDSGGNIAVDMSSGFNFTMTMDGDYTLSAPSNGKPGQTGCIVFTQDGTGTQTLAYNSAWKFAGGTDPVLSTAASSVDILFYQVLANGTDVYANLVKAVA